MLHTKVATLGRERDERAHEFARLALRRGEWERRFGAAQGEFEQQRAAHHDVLGQLDQELEVVRHERDAALRLVDELTVDRDRHAALHAEVSRSHRDMEASQKAELSRLTERCAGLLAQLESERTRASTLSTQVETLGVGLDEVRHTATAERQARERALITPRGEPGVTRQAAGISPARAAATPGSIADDVQRAPAAADFPLLRSDTSHRVQVDALRIALQGVEGLIIDWDEAREGQPRDRSALERLGIHTI
jgi:hypothetical protein